jgi:phosphatidylinositol 3-kinase
VDGSHYQAIFKSGDDLRQDQLVIQLITLMDDLLRKENLDLKLMPYKVLATGADHGMVQFVASQSLANVLNENNGSLLMFWRKYHLDERSVDTFGVKPEVMDAYVKSCGKGSLWKKHIIMQQNVCDGVVVFLQDSLTRPYFLA